MKKEEYITIPYKMLKMDITPRALLLYGIIYKLSARATKDSYATNKYFMKELNVNSNKTIYNLILELEIKQCIKIRYSEENPNIRYITPLIINEVEYRTDGYESKEKFEEL